MEVLINFTRSSCPSCNMIFFIPTNFYNRLINCHNTFYCPQGHSIIYPAKTDREIEIERLKERNQALLNELSKKKPTKRKSKKA